MKSDPETIDIPVIIHSIIDGKETCFILGATDYILKPADKSTILRKLGELSLLKKRQRLPVNILILTEDIKTGDKLKESLEHEGFIIHALTDIENVINTVISVKPDAMIVDLTSKKVLESIGMLKESALTKNIPVYGLTDSSLSILKIDHFENYVDKKGIYYGNLLLKKIAEILKKNLRFSDILTRFERDSFAIILPNTLLGPSITISKRFIEIIRDYPFLYEEVQPDKRVTVSIGVTDYKGQSPEELIHSAEKALRHAIEKGRNRVESTKE